MNKTVLVLASACLGAVAYGGVESMVVHELQDGYKSTDEALRHIGEANANHVGQFGGHEGKATELLKQARKEIEEADKFFREHPPKK